MSTKDSCGGCATYKCQLQLDPVVARALFFTPGVGRCWDEGYSGGGRGGRGGPKGSERAERQYNTWLLRNDKLTFWGIPRGILN